MFWRVGDECREDARGKWLVKDSGAGWNTNGDGRRLGRGAYDPVDHLLLRVLSSVYGAERILGRGEGDARPRL